MNNIYRSLAMAALMSTAGLAATINYNTTGSTLSCNGTAGCTQNTTTSVTLGGLRLTYNTGFSSGVVTPSTINLGSIISTGTATNVNVSGLLLTINVNSTPPGSSGALPTGSLSGNISSASSAAILSFAVNNTTTNFGTLPGVKIGNLIFQVLNPTLNLQAPTAGSPAGQTSIQGAVTDSSATAPEPTTMLLMTAGLALVVSLRGRASK